MIRDALVRYKLVSKRAVNGTLLCSKIYTAEDEGMNRMTTRKTICAIQGSVKTEPALILRALLLLIRP